VVKLFSSRVNRFPIAGIITPHEIKCPDWIEICARACHASTERVYSGRTKYSAFVSKLSKLSEEYLSPQKTQKAPVFFYSKNLGQENELKS
jgi:hypothetical protein